MDILDFITRLREQGEEEAYWRALEQVFGPSSSRVLKAVLLAKIPAEGLTERERVAWGLEGLLDHHSRTIEALAHRQAPVGKPRSFDPGEAATHDHWIHFLERPEEETEGALRFLDEGLRRDAKVVVWGPSRILEAVEREMEERADGMPGGPDRVAFVPADGQLQLVQELGDKAPAASAIDEIVRDAQGASHRELWACGYVAGRLFEMGAYNLAVGVENCWHDYAAKLPLTVYCPYPAGPNADPQALLDLAQRHNGFALGPQVYPLNFPLAGGP